VQFLVLGKLTALAKERPADFAAERLFPCVNVEVLSEVLLGRQLFAAEVAGEAFHLKVAAVDMPL